MEMDEDIGQTDRIRTMMDITETRACDIALDHGVGCNDVLELVTRLKGVPHDKATTFSDGAQRRTDHDTNPMDSSRANRSHGSRCD
eukprot:1064613-Pyramimonas_sp.AAC.2